MLSSAECLPTRGDHVDVSQEKVMFRICRKQNVENNMESMHLSIIYLIIHISFNMNYCLWQNNNLKSEY